MTDALYPMKDAPKDREIDAFHKKAVGTSEPVRVSWTEFTGDGATPCWTSEVGNLYSNDEFKGWLPALPDLTSPSVAKNAGERLAVCEPEDVAEAIRVALARDDVRAAFSGRLPKIPCPACNKGER